MDYFFSSPDLIRKPEIIIEGDEFNHLTHVMRKKKGDVIFIIDGVGTAYEASIQSLDRKSATCKIIKTFPNHNEPVINLTLAVGILKNHSRFDMLVEKVTEIGVKEIIPLRTERSIPSSAKIERWRKIALSAAKQCGRAYIPQVSELYDITTLLKQDRTYELKFIAHEKSREKISQHKQVLSVAKNIIMVIGPEGGFTDREIQILESAGYLSVSISQRRLRTETAAIVASSLILEYI